MAKKELKIGCSLVGGKNPVFMIAEIGINHNGDIQVAKKLIDASFASEWDCVKFQKRTPDLCVPDEQKNVMRDTPWGRMTYLDYRYKVEFGDKEYNYIDKYCKEKPICWTASAWDIPSLRFLLNHNVAFIKIPSAKLTDREMLMAAAESGKPVILSTGMSFIKEIDTAVDILEKYAEGRYILLHTNSTYPSPPEDINLRTIITLRKRYGCIVGYSGHEYDLEPTVIAALMGAKVIERHVTLDHNMWGSDHFASLEVHAMKILRNRIVDIDVLLGDGVKRVTEKEKEIRKKLRGV